MVSTGGKAWLGLPWLCRCHFEYDCSSGLFGDPTYPLPCMTRRSPAVPLGSGHLLMNEQQGARWRHLITTPALAGNGSGTPCHTPWAWQGRGRRHPRLPSRHLSLNPAHLWGGFWSQMFWQMSKSLGKQMRCFLAIRVLSSLIPFVASEGLTPIIDGLLWSCQSSLSCFLFQLPSSRKDNLRKLVSWEFNIYYSYPVDTRPWGQQPRITVRHLAQRFLLKRCQMCSKVARKELDSEAQVLHSKLS